MTDALSHSSGAVPSEDPKLTRPAATGLPPIISKLLSNPRVIYVPVRKKNRPVASNTENSAANLENQRLVADTSPPDEIPALDNLRIIRLPELIALTGLSRSSIYNRLNPKSRHFDADFPPRINLTRGGARSGAVGWRFADVKRWLSNRPAA